MKKSLRQNIDNAATHGVGVTVAVRGLRATATLDGAGLVNRLYRAISGGVLHVSRSERVARLAESGDVHGASRAGVVRSYADIHAQTLDPLWRTCKGIA